MKFSLNTIRLVQKNRSREAFTIMEVLLAASIFTVVSMICVTVFINLIRIQKRVELENAIYEDARFMMERITREVRQNTIDYEEYYNKTIHQEGAFQNVKGLTTNGQNPYGNTYGCYAKRFYDPGSGGTTNAGYGALCAYPPNVPVENAACESVNKNTLDIEEFKNPYNFQENTASAFCDDKHSTKQCSGSTADYNKQAQLYLINSQGTEKTIFALKETSATYLDLSDGVQKSEHALGLLKLTGQDNNHDNVTETWRGCSDSTGTPSADNPFCCTTGFNCPKDYVNDSLEATLEYNANDLYSGFIPISPTRSDIVSLEFFVAPIEDPQKAAAETDSAIHQQPHVTIVLTLKPSQRSMSGYSGEIPSVTLQTTVTSRVYNEVKSFYTSAGGDCEEN